MAYTTWEARQRLLDTVARAANELGFVSAVEAVAVADRTVADLQDSMLPVEAGGGGVRAGAQGGSGAARQLARQPPRLPSRPRALAGSRLPEQPRPGSRVGNRRDVGHSTASTPRRSSTPSRTGGPRSSPRAPD